LETLETTLISLLDGVNEEVTVKAAKVLASLYLCSNDPVGYWTRVTRKLIFGMQRVVDGFGFDSQSSTVGKLKI
jgi:hypothetical protein